MILKKLYKSIIFFLFVVFITHIIFNLEKIIFVNEIFAFIGILFFLVTFKKYLKSKIRKSFFYLILLISYFSIYVVFSFFFLRDGNFYQFFRTLTLWYSIFSFFLGLEFFKIIDSNFWKKNQLRYTWIHGIIGLFVGKKLSNPMIYTMALGKYKYYFWLSYLFLVLHMLMKWGGDGNSTSLMVVLGYGGYFILYYSRIIRSLFLNKYIIIIVFIFGLFTLNYVFEIFKPFYKIGFIYFGKDSDTNLLWRLMYWSYEVNHNIKENLIFGIGYGKGLFDMSDPYVSFVTAAEPDDLNLPYTHGTHNSFIYILIRSGAVGLLLFLNFLVNLFKDYFNSSAHKNPNIRGYGIAFLIINFAAMFNVVIESSLYAGIYWISAGILFGGIENQYKINQRLN